VHHRPRRTPKLTGIASEIDPFYIYYRLMPLILKTFDPFSLPSVVVFCIWFLLDFYWYYWCENVIYYDVTMVVIKYFTEYTYQGNWSVVNVVLPVTFPLLELYLYISIVEDFFHNFMKFRRCFRILWRSKEKARIDVSVIRMMIIGFILSGPPPFDTLCWLQTFFLCYSHLLRSWAFLSFAYWLLSSGGDIWHQTFSWASLAKVD
jgi:hypothetical protein